VTTKFSGIFRNTPRSQIERANIVGSFAAHDASAEKSMWRFILYAIVFMTVADWYFFDSFYLNGLMHMVRDMRLWFGF
jgi:hypothetical protein